jgi:hypothetical protein
MPTESECLQKGENKLVREGTSQTMRFLDALKPTYAPIDERRLEHGVVFAKAYSNYVRYYDSNNVEVDDWQRFFSEDVSVMLAEAAIQNIDYYRLKVKSCFDVLKSNKSSEKELKTNLGYLFSAAGTLARQLDLLKERLPADMPLKGAIQNVIQRQLAPALKRLIAYYKAGTGKGLITTTAAPDLKIFESVCEPFESVCQNFSSDWITDPAKTTWIDFANGITADGSVYGIGTGIFEQINHIATHNLFSTIFDLFLKAYARTATDAANALADSLSNRDDHQPHFTLFLAFLELMGFARDQMNKLTGKHLDFYFKEVLRLKEKPDEPNHAHLLIQLAKNRESYLLKSATAFNGGKDSLGKEVAYTLDKEFVANIAAVKAFKSIYRSGSSLYALPVTNSDDGRGAELTSVDKAWHPFIGKIETDNLATLGFAISSHYLLLGENQRRIRLKLAFTKKVVSQDEICKAFDFQLTGEKEWISAKVATPEGEDFSTAKAKSVEIPLLLEGNLSAVVALDHDLHGKALPAGLPALKAVLKQGIASQATLEALRSLVLDLDHCTLELCVGYDSFSSIGPNEKGVKNLSIHTKFGQVKPDKPFQPFGPLPEKNDYLIIGCDEVFQKKNARFQFRVVWKGLPAWRGDIDYDWVNEFYPNVSLTLLKNGTWGSTPDVGKVQVFYGVRPDIYFPSLKINLGLLEDAVSDIHFEPLSYTQESRKGFLKLTLLDDFGHSLYRQTLTRYLMKMSMGLIGKTVDRNTVFQNARNKLYTPDASGKWVPKDEYKYDFTEKYIEEFSNAMPTEPYTPQIESLTLSYTASVTLSDPEVTLNWLTPFGYQKVESNQKASLLPAFDNEGEFYIGIENLTPGQSLSLLFQLAEGSADPTIKKPDNHVEWCYLAGNGWVPFGNTSNSDKINDETGQLTRSGIISYAIPKEATKTDTLFLPAGYYWLRASVHERSVAVCKAIDVVAQAARVTFLDQGNAPDFLSAQLPAGSITKLLTPDAAVKKATQPYPTFGGRTTETADTFYMRVSERLRHKNRAITLWDYERLVLEAFPQIYKVKCLNHTHYEPLDDGSYIYREAAPGHVTMVTIPNLHNNNAIDPLRPYTNLGDLDLINNFLQHYVSSFVKLHVFNPVFESIRVEFKVKYYDFATDDSYYTPLLQASLVNFLSPWVTGEGKDISFGGKIYKSALIDFVEEQSYVDFVTDFKLFHKIGEKESNDTDEVSASKAISILVSAYAEEHSITKL